MNERSYTKEELKRAIQAYEAIDFDTDYDVALTDEQLDEGIEQWFEDVPEEDRPITDLKKDAAEAFENIYASNF